MRKVYRWCPKGVVVEREECGQLVAFTASEQTCGECGADHGAILEEEGLEARLEGLA